MKEMPKIFLNIVNRYAQCRDENDISWEDLTETFPLLTNKTEPPDGNVPVTSSVHCECTISIKMLEGFQDQNLHRRSVKIGVSKQTCWLCQRYLEFLERNLNPEVKFIVSGFQGKIHAGWKPPAGRLPGR